MDSLGLSIAARRAACRLEGRNQSPVLLPFSCGSAFDQVRLNVQQKASDFRRQGFFGIAMASKTELGYTGLEDTLSALDAQFEMRQDERSAVTVSSTAGDSD